MIAMFLAAMTAIGGFAYVDNQPEQVRDAEVKTLANDRTYGVDVQ